MSVKPGSGPKDAYRWVRFQFICLDEENVMPGMMTLIATDVQESHSRNEQLMNSLKEAYQSAEEANKAKSVFSAVCPMTSALL